MYKVQGLFPDANALQKEREKKYLAYTRFCLLGKRGPFQSQMCQGAEAQVNACRGPLPSRVWAVCGSACLHTQASLRFCSAPLHALLTQC